MPSLPATRVGDDIAHSNAGTGMLLGVLAGVAVGAVLIGATIATGGAALVLATGAAMGAVSAGGLGGMYIGEASMGPPCGKFTVGSRNVFVNSRAAIFTFGSTAACGSDGPLIPLATGAQFVTINGGLAGRETEKLGCSAVSIAKTSPNVFIGGPSAQDPRVTIEPEVPEWAVTGLQVLGIAGALIALPAAVMTVGVGATIGGGLLGLAGSIGGTMGGRALGEALGLSEAGIRAMETAGGVLGGMVGGAAGARGGTAAQRRFNAWRANRANSVPPPPVDPVPPPPPPKPPFQPKKIGELEEGAVPTTPKLEAARDAAQLHTGKSAKDFPGYADDHPDLPDWAAKTFGPGARPWDGDKEAGTLMRVIDADSNPAGSFWQRAPLSDEAGWRGPAAVKNDWNGDGGFVETPSSGLKGWVGPAAPQDASVPGYMLPGDGEQIWLPGNVAKPGGPMPTPWNPGTGP